MIEHGNGHSQLNKRVINKNTKEVKEHLITPIEDAYDNIDECNIDVSHLNIAYTWRKVRDKYALITQDMVSIFVKKCPICISDPPKHHRTKVQSVLSGHTAFAKGSQLTSLTTSNRVQQTFMEWSNIGL